VLIAATFGPADRLWGDWLHFDQTEHDSRFLTKAAFDEFALVVEGIGGSPGIYETLLGDAIRAIRSASPMEPDASVIRRVNPERPQGLERLIVAVRASVGGVWNSTKALQALRGYEKEFAERKRAFLSKHRLFDPPESDELSAMFQALLNIIPAGGMSWDWDCRILSQTAAYKSSAEIEVHFVTDDQRHVGKHSGGIKALTQISVIRSLAGVVL
jgi:hypothetical protein